MSFEFIYSEQVETFTSLRLPDILCMSPLAADASSESLSLKIGFLGLGTMGASIVSALLQAGHNVTVWNRTPSKVSDCFVYKLFDCSHLPLISVLPFEAL